MSFDGDELRRLLPRRQPSLQAIHNVNRVKSFGVKRKSAFRPPFLATCNAAPRGSGVSGLYFEPCPKYCVVFGSWRWRCPRWRSRVSQPRRRSYRPEPSSASQSCAAKPDQSYALYLPSHYVPNKKWPIVYAFDPDARGEIPVKLMQDAAEHFGYIVVGSNNSRNGSWKMETEAAQAMWNDTHARFAIDDRRIYFAGFSGGARVAAGARPELQMRGRRAAERRRLCWSSSFTRRRVSRLRGCGRL